MQTTTPAFDANAVADIRKISWSVRASFDKTLNAGSNFFQLDVSQLDGPDLLQGSGSTIAEWDKYSYTDYSDRVMSVEWSRVEDEPFSVTTAIATITLNNTDDFFTPGVGSAIDGNILPRRPFKISAGFNNSTIPVFVGLNERMPIIDNQAKTATFHCVDFLSSILNRDIDQTQIFIDQRIDQIIESLLQDQGLVAGQYSLDVGRVKVPFAAFDKGTKLGNAIRSLAQADIAYVFMDELGIIQFKNYAYRTSVPVATFDTSNTLEWSNNGDSDLINVVEVKADVREVQPLQPVWQSVEQVSIQPGSSVQIWADFLDPVTSVQTPTAGLSSTNSYYVADGTLTVSGTAFSNSYRMTFTNPGSSTATITDLEVWATPATVTNTLRERYEDTTSTAKYDEQVLEVSNPYIQTESNARSIATLILDSYAEYKDTLKLVVKGNPALQIGDAVTVSVGTVSDDYVITAIDNRYSDGGYTQIIKVKNIVFRDYFKLGVSQLDGTHVLGF